jgi:hypothetical protein
MHQVVYPSTTEFRNHTIIYYLQDNLRIPEAISKTGGRLPRLKWPY